MKRKRVLAQSGPLRATALGTTRPKPPFQEKREAAGVTARGLGGPEESA